MIPVHSIETLGTHEGPGVRVVIFLQGCLLRCLYCHNPDSQEIRSSKEYSVEQLLDIILSEKEYFHEKGGVTFSGGEPLLHARNLLPLCQELRLRGIHVALDTSGYIFNDAVKELLSFVDLVLLDIKQMDDAKHMRLTGVSNKNILQFARYLEKNCIPFWVRHVLVPGYTLDDESLHALGRFVGLFEYLKRLELLPYHRLGITKYDGLEREYALRDVPVPTQEELAHARKILEKYVGVVKVRGL